MPRPLRIEFPGACYHVMSRANVGSPIFRADADKTLLLDRMVHFAALFQVDIRAYCIMINHFHLYLRTPEGNLGAFMQSFLTSFTSRYNHRHDVHGHVFQGRYKAFLVEDAKAYRSKVTQYIHLNPARIPSLADKPVDVRHEAALHYPWSSYGEVLGLRSCPSWLDRNAVLKGWGNNLAEKREAYRTAVERLLLAECVDPAEEAAARIVLGGKRFVDRMQKALQDPTANRNVREEGSQVRKLRAWHSLDEVIDVVRKAYGTSRKALLRRYNRGCEARQVLLYLAATHCRGRYSLTELGEALGSISLAAVSNARTKMRRRMAAETELRKRVEKLSDQISRL